MKQISKSAMCFILVQDQAAALFHLEKLVLGHQHERVKQLLKCGVRVEVLENSAAAVMESAAIQEHIRKKRLSLLQRQIHLVWY
jgi:hypothetical protein